MDKQLSPLSRVRGALESWSRRRRFNCQDQDAPDWEKRAEAAVGLVRTAFASSSGERLQVADLGAGNQRLRSILERELDVPCDYHAYDIRPQSPDVERLDVERTLPERRFDVVFCLGLLEYLRDLDDFASRLRTICRFAVVSYVVTDPPGSLDPAARRTRGWLTDLTRSDVDALFRRNGYIQASFVPTSGGRTGLWLWSTSADAAVPSA
jgi:hypothetical protein